MRTALLLLLMTAGATKVFAQFTDPDGYFKYTITDYENHYVAIGYFPNTTNLPDNYIGMLPSTVTYENVTYTVTSLANSAFGNCNKLLAVGIPDRQGYVVGQSHWLGFLFPPAFYGSVPPRSHHLLYG